MIGPGWAFAFGRVAICDSSGVDRWPSDPAARVAGSKLQLTVSSSECVQPHVRMHRSNSNEHRGARVADFLQWVASGRSVCSFDGMALLPPVSLQELRVAMEASWSPDTAYLGVCEPGNPALGQCYPTARVVQWFFPNLEIARGTVNTGLSLEAHFWNVDPTLWPAAYVDLSWQQFPPKATVEHFEILQREALVDSPGTVARCERLLRCVLRHLAN